MHKKLLVLMIAMTQVMVMAKGPIMKYVSREVDLGKVAPGKRVQAIFKFTNIGDKKLIIKSVKPGCGCTTVALEKTAFSPGESGTIKAYFNTANYNGSVTKTIQVYSNTNGGGNIIRLKLKATVVTDLKPARTSIYFRNVVPGKSYTERVYIENHMHKPLEIKGHNIAGNANASRNFPLTVGLVRSKDGKEYVSVTLKVLKDMPVLERTSFTLSLDTNSMKMPKMNLFIIIRMMPPIQVQPISLFMFGNHLNAKRTRRIQLKCNTGKPLKIESVHDSGKTFTFETIREDKETINLWIGIKADAALGVFNEIIRIVAKEGNVEHKFFIPARGSVIR